MIDVVPICLFSLPLVFLTRCYWCIDTVASVVSNYFKSQVSGVSDHYSVDFLGKGRVF